MSLGLLAMLALPGCVAGFLGGLFGIGGGIVLVPILTFYFMTIGVDPSVQIKLALGTSLSIIIVTAARSLHAHLGTGRVDIGFLRQWLPFVAAGSLFSGFAARFIASDILALIFAAGAIGIGVSKLRPRKQPYTDGPASHPAGQLSKPLLLPVTFMTGLVSGLLGIGGGAAGVLLMRSLGAPMHRAVATASGFGLGVAIPGTIGYILAGLSTQASAASARLPDGAIGFVHLPAFLVVALATAVTAPYGARLAHRLKGHFLSQGFALYVLIVAALMVRKVIAG